MTSNYFEITPENGATDEFRVELTSAIKLTPDATCNGIEVIVDDEFIATDFGSPDSRTNRANVRVIITDANDHTPIYTFDQNPPRLRVKEQSLKGTVIGIWLLKIQFIVDSLLLKIENLLWQMNRWDLTLMNWLE